MNEIHLYIHVIRETQTPEEALLKRSGFTGRNVSRQNIAKAIDNARAHVEALAGKNGPRKRRGRPKGSKNKKVAGYIHPAFDGDENAAVVRMPASKKRGRPFGSRNKPKPVLTE